MKECVSCCCCCSRPVRNEDETDGAEIFTETFLHALTQSKGVETRIRIADSEISGSADFGLCADDFKKIFCQIDTEYDGDDVRTTRISKIVFRTPNRRSICRFSTTLTIFKIFSPKWRPNTMLHGLLEWV